VDPVEASAAIDGGELAGERRLGAPQHRHPEMVLLAQDRPAAGAVLHREGDQRRIQGDAHGERRGHQTVADTIDLRRHQDHALGEVRERLAERGVGQHDRHCRRCAARGTGPVLSAVTPRHTRWRPRPGCPSTSGYASAGSAGSGWRGLERRRKQDPTRPTAAIPAATRKATFTPWIAPATPYSSGSRAAAVITVTSTPVPTEAATCRIVLFTAAPCGIIRGLSWFRAAVVTGIITIAVPNIRTALTIAMYQNPVSTVSRASMTLVIVSRAKPLIASAEAPKRSKIRPVAGDMKPMTSAPGSSTSPDCIAVKSLMFCMNSGIISIPPIIAMNTSIPSTVPRANMRLLSTRSSSSGSSRR